MSQSDPNLSPVTPDRAAAVAATSPWRCFGGVLISAPLGYALYRLTISMAQTLAAHPIKSDSTLAANIAVLVRTLVVGITALGTGIFALVSLGLLALGIQLLFKPTAASETSSPSQDA